MRFKGFRKLGLLPGGIFYVIKPLIVGLIPYPILKRIRMRAFKKKAQNNASAETD